MTETFSIFLFVAIFLGAAILITLAITLPIWIYKIYLETTRIRQHIEWISRHTGPADE